MTCILLTIQQTYIRFSIAAITNYWKLHSIIQYKFMISQLLQARSPGLFLEPQKAEIQVLAVLCSFLQTLGKKSSSFLLQTVGRIQFLKIVKTEVLFPCQMLTEGFFSFQMPTKFLISQSPSSIFEVSNGGLNPSHTASH